MTLAAAEDWLKAVCQDVLGDDIVVVGGPGGWDDSYYKKFLTKLPAVVVAFEGGTVGSGTSVTMDGLWTLYVVTGWEGEGEDFRRRGDAANKGAWYILETLIVRLHNTNMGERQYSARGTGQAVANIPALDGTLDGFRAHRSSATMVGERVDQGARDRNRDGVVFDGACQQQYAA